MVLGLILYASATFACGLAQNVIQLGLAQFLAGVGGASYHPVGIPIISMVVSKQKRGQAMGMHQTGGAIGSFVVPVTAAYIGVVLGWRYSFIILSLLGIITIFFWQRIDKLRFGDQEEREHANPNKTIFKSATVKFLLVLFIFGLLHVLPFRGLTPFLTTYATEKYGLRLESAAQLLSWLQMMGIVGSPLFGKLSDIVGRQKMLAILILCQSLVMYLITRTSFEILAFLLGAMGLLAYGCLAVTDTWVTEMSVASIIGTAVGVVVTASFFIGAIITPMVGFLADQISFDFAFRILSVATLLGLPILRYVKCEKKETIDTMTQ